MQVRYIYPYPHLINNFYTVKKIRLRASQSDQKIFREVTALARLYHRYIVRYYTTWVETSENVSAVASTVGSSVGSSAGTSIPNGRSSGATTAGDEADSDPFFIDLNELNSTRNEDRHSFPSIHFTRSATPDLSESDPSDEELFVGEESSFAGSPGKVVKKAPTPVPTVTRTLYIQMVCSQVCMRH